MYILILTSYEQNYLLILTFFNIFFIPEIKHERFIKKVELAKIPQPDENFCRTNIKNVDRMKNKKASKSSW